MAKFKYFELSEFIVSQEAKKRGIDNTPTFEIVEHLSKLVEKILDPLREAYGKPITITSGYRCPRLNQVVGGVATSVHKIGYAADITAKDLNDLANFLLGWVKSRGIMFDQILIEEKKSTKSKWIHIALYNNNGQQRRIISNMQV